MCAEGDTEGGLNMEQEVEMCEDCGERPVRFIVRRRVMITDLLTGNVIDSPKGTYEEELMTDNLCAECAMEQYSDDVVEEN